MKKGALAALTVGIAIVAGGLLFFALRSRKAGQSCGGLRGRCGKGFACKNGVCIPENAVRGTTDAILGDWLDVSEQGQRQKFRIERGVDSRLPFRYALRAEKDGVFPIVPTAVGFVDGRDGVTFRFQAGTPDQVDLTVKWIVFGKVFAFVAGSQTIALIRRA